MTSEQFEKAVSQFKKAKFVFETSRLGSEKGDRAELTMERLVAKAEAQGVLAKFVQAVTA